MSCVFSAARAVRAAAGVSVFVSAFGLAACSSDGLDPRPPADVGFHSASVPESAELIGRSAGPTPRAPVYEEEQQVAQVYAQPNDPSDYATDAQADPLSDESLGEEFGSRPEPSLGRVVVEEPPMSFPQDAPSSEPEEQEMAALPRSERPIEPDMSFEPVRPRIQPMSSDEVACRQKLKKYKVKFVELKPIRDSASCQIAHPVKVYSIGSVEMKPAATLNCEMAATFAAWTRNELVPSSRWKYLSGIQTIHQGSAYSCRKIARSKNMSAHSQGNALDVMAITLNNGKKIDIKKQGFFAFRARGLLNTVRADGCQYFSTVLGPGYNYDHRNHFHFDLMQRKSGRVACH